MDQRKVYIGLPLLIYFLWESVIRLTGVPPFLLPPPGLVFSTMIEEWRTLAVNTGATLQTALTGYALANIFSLGLSVCFLYLPWFEEYTKPLVLFLKNIPFIAIATLLYIWLGDGIQTKILLVVMVTFFPILANVTAGLKSANRSLIERMYILNASRFQTFRHVRWPAALPFYFAAHMIGFTSCILAAMIAEWLIAHNGLGALLINARAAYRIDLVFAVVLDSSILNTFAYFIVDRAERRVLHWRYTP